MITREEFWKIIEAYGTRIWPIQIIFYIAAIVLAGWFFFKPGRIQSLITKLFLSIAFGWNGIMFYMILARDMAGDSYGNYFFGSVFILVSVLFAVDLVRQKMRFIPSTAGWQKYATSLLMLLVFCYPLFGTTSGRGFTSLITPGTFPCPTTALGLLLLTTALPRVDKVIYILLLFCAIPFTPFFQIARYGVYEDVILFFTGIYSLVLLVRYWNSDRPSAQPPAA
jgi:hypothetical protein